MLVRSVQDENSFGLGPHPAKEGVENLYGGGKQLNSVSSLPKKSFGGGTRKALGNITNQPAGKQYDTVRAKTPGTELKQRRALGDITNFSEASKHVPLPGSDAKLGVARADPSGQARGRELPVDRAEAPLGRTWIQLESERLQKDRAERAARVRHIVSQPMRYPAPPLDEAARQREALRLFTHLELPPLPRPPTPPASPLADQSKEDFETSDVHLESSVWDIAAGELEVNFEEDPLERHFADTEQRMGSPPTPTGRQHDGEGDALCPIPGGPRDSDGPGGVSDGSTS